MNSNAVKNGFKDMGMYAMVLVTATLGMIFSAVVIGIVDEQVIVDIGLADTGAAATFIDGVITVIFSALTAIAGIATLGSSLAILQILARMFGFNFNMGLGKKDY